MATSVSDDHTGHFDYRRLVAQERQHFAEEAEITDELRLGGIHAHRAWQYYWQRTFATVPRPDEVDVVAQLGRRFADDVPLRILSLGSGYCGEELAFVERLHRPCSVRCTDLNGDLFTQARERAAAAGQDFTFEEVDLNFITLEPERWHVVFAHASLHHVVNLERLFAEVRRALVPGGLFQVVEVIGQNRRLLWPENERFARRIVRLLPRSIRGWSRLAVHEHSEGMEGIRQQEIPGLLEQHFQPVVELRHGAFMRALCLHRRLGPRLDPADAAARAWLDWLIDVDRAAVRRGLLRPLELWGLYEPQPAP